MISSKKTPKILIVSGTPPPYSGPEIMTAHLLQSSLRDRYQLIHFNISKGRGVNEKARFDLFNITYGLLQPLILIWLLLRHRPNLVYTNLAQNLGGFLRYASFILPATLFRVPVVVRTMGDGFNHFHDRSGWVLRGLIRLVLKCIDCFIVRADLLQAQYAGLVPPHKLCTVYSGIDVNEFRSSQGASPEQDAPTRILFVGYLTKAKGAHDLLQAIPLVTEKSSNVKFQFMGERVDVERNITYIDNPNSNRQVLDELLGDPNIAPHVELLGVLSGQAKIDAFCNADLFVFPSYSEAFPTVVLEAMAAGLPIVTTPVGALPEVFTDEQITFVEVGDVSQLAEAIVTLLEEPARRSQIGLNNRILVRKQFSLETHARRMDTLFQYCLGRQQISNVETSSDTAPVGK